MGKTAEKPSTFGTLLKHYRVTAQLTQEELAERSCLSARAVSDLERGVRRNPYRDTVRQLADALELSATDRAVLERAARRARESPPALTTPSVPSPSLGKLPEERTVFVGREHELLALATLLVQPEIRLVSLTGPGGIGKTRLAIRVGARLQRDFSDGVFFVSLASINDPRLVPATITRTLGIDERSGQRLTDTLSAFLETKRSLLILDNFEHLLPACATVTELLDACPHLRILVTSRSVLRLSSEHEYHLAPLALPDLTDLPEVSILSQCDAIELFCERARAIQPGFSLTDENARTIAEICHRLDGLPLALELAAARIRLFPAPALLRRLTQRLPLLTGGALDLPARHQTLRQALDWSYSLMSPGEQILFARLSVFAGGCTLEAIDDVCTTESGAVEDVLDVVASLVEKSMLRQEGEREPRFVMLETIREYAQERLADQGALQELRRRHAEYYLRLAESVRAESPEGAQVPWLDRLEAERDNVRAALRWTCEEGDVEVGLGLAVTLGPFWETRGPLSEGRRWIEELLAVADARRAAPPRPLHAAALFVAGQLACICGQSWEGIDLLERSLALYRELGDKLGSGQAVAVLALQWIKQREREKAATLLEEAACLAQETGDAALLEMSLRFLGGLAEGRGDRERARELWRASGQAREEVLTARAAATPSSWYNLSLAALGVLSARGVSDVSVTGSFQADHVMNQAFTERNWGNYAEAARILEDDLRRAEALADRRRMAYIRYILALIARDQGKYERAEALTRENLVVFQELEDVTGVALALAGLSNLANNQGDADRGWELAQRSLALYHDVGESFFIGFSLRNLAVAARQRHEYERSALLLEESLAVFRELAGASVVAEVLADVALLALEQGEYERAGLVGSEALAMVRKAGMRHVLGTLLEVMAEVAAAQGRGEDSARLFGAADAVRSRLGTPRPPAHSTLYAAHLTTCRASLADAEYTSAWEEGRAMTIEQSVAYALEGHLEA